MFSDAGGVPPLLLKAPELMKAFVAWVENAAQGPLPDSFDANFPPAAARPDAWPAWAPWVPAAHHATLRGDFPFGLLAQAGVTQAQLIDAVHAALAPLGLVPSRLPNPLGLLPMVMEACNATGEVSDRGRLVFVVYSTVGTTPTAAMVLVRP